MDTRIEATIIENQPIEAVVVDNSRIEATIVQNQPIEAIIVEDEI